MTQISQETVETDAVDHIWPTTDTVPGIQADEFTTAILCFALTLDQSNTTFIHK